MLLLWYTVQENYCKDIIFSYQDLRITAISSRGDWPIAPTDGVYFHIVRKSCLYSIREGKTRSNYQLSIINYQLFINEPLLRDS